MRGRTDKESEKLCSRKNHSLCRRIFSTGSLILQSSLSSSSSSSSSSSFNKEKFVKSKGCFEQKYLLSKYTMWLCEYCIYVYGDCFCVRVQNLHPHITVQEAFLISELWRGNLPSAPPGSVPEFPPWTLWRSCWDLSCCRRKSGWWVEAFYMLHGPSYVAVWSSTFIGCSHV